MSKILVITPACHFASPGAAQKDIYATIGALQAQGHTVSLCTIDSPQQDAYALKKVSEKYNIAVEKFLPPPAHIRAWRVLAHPLLIDGSAAVFDSLVRSDWFKNYIAKNKPDCLWVFCSYGHPVLSFAKKNNIPTIFRSHNFESSFFWESLTPLEKCNPLNIVRACAKFYGEKIAAQSATGIATLPFAGARYYDQWRRGSGVFRLTLMFLPSVVGTARIHHSKKPLDIFYLGASYNIVFHRKGAEILIRDIAPAVEKIAPGQFRFHVCGAKLPSALVALCTNQCRYEGYVKDLDEFLGDMDIGVFPVFTGSTMKGKVFESLARSFPTVLTTNCLGNYPLKNGKEVMVADTVQAFVENICLLAYEKQRALIASGAEKFSERELSMAAVSRVLSNIQAFLAL